MIRLAVAAIIVFLCLVMPANAKPASQVSSPNCDQRYMHTCWGDWQFTPKGKKAVRKAIPFRHIQHRVHRGAGDIQTGRRATERPTQRLAREAPASASKSLHGVVGPLAEKAEAIVRTCGSWIMSAVRHTQVAGSGRLSCHAVGKAVDISGNPSCIYAQLKGWRGGYSTDYSHVRCHGVSCPHVHVSLGCSEDGKRFVHYGTRVRHARHHRMARS